MWTHREMTQDEGLLSGYFVSSSVGYITVNNVLRNDGH